MRGRGCGRGRKGEGKGGGGGQGRRELAQWLIRSRFCLWWHRAVPPVQGRTHAAASPPRQSGGRCRTEVAQRITSCDADASLVRALLPSNPPPREWVRLARGRAGPVQRPSRSRPALCSDCLAGEGRLRLREGRREGRGGGGVKQQVREGWRGGGGRTESEL